MVVGVVHVALWCAARYLDDYEEALWLTVSGLGDRDTTCAIVGGIVACCTGSVAIPRRGEMPANRCPHGRSGPKMTVGDYEPCALLAAW